MGRIFESMSAFFDADDWSYEVLPGGSILRMGFSGADGKWTCFAQAREAEEQFVFYSVAPFKTPEERRLPMAEFITRANYNMIIGNVELDLQDGEVRYKTALDVQGTELSHALMKGLVYANVLTMDRYFKGILAVAFGGVDASRAAAGIEDG